jgi:hypothetical protein
MLHKVSSELYNAVSLFWLVLYAPSERINQIGIDCALSLFDLGTYLSDCPSERKQHYYTNTQPHVICICIQTVQYDTPTSGISMHVRKRRL